MSLSSVSVCKSNAKVSEMIINKYSGNICQSNILILVWWVPVFRSFVRGRHVDILYLIPSPHQRRMSRFKSAINSASFLKKSHNLLGYVML